jgi:hypothetical protein
MEEAVSRFSGFDDAEREVLRRALLDAALHSRGSVRAMCHRLMDELVPFQGIDVTTFHTPTVTNCRATGDVSPAVVPVPDATPPEPELDHEHTIEPVKLERVEGESEADFSLRAAQEQRRRLDARHSRVDTPEHRGRALRKAAAVWGSQWDGAA